MILFSRPSVLLSFIPICVLFLFSLSSAPFFFLPRLFFFLMSHFWLCTYCPLPFKPLLLPLHSPTALSFAFLEDCEYAWMGPMIGSISHQQSQKYRFDTLTQGLAPPSALQCSFIRGGAGALSMSLKFGCVCDRCKGLVCPKIHQFSPQHFVNTGSGDVFKSA